MDRVVRQEAAADPVAGALEEEDRVEEDRVAGAVPLEEAQAAEVGEEIKAAQGPEIESSNRRHGTPRPGWVSWFTRARSPTSMRP